MTRRRSPFSATAHQPPSVEEALRTIAQQLALLADVLRVQAQIEPDDGLRPAAMHALSSLCDDAQAQLTTLRRHLPVATLNMVARSANE